MTRIWFGTYIDGRLRRPFASRVLGWLLIPLSWPYRAIVWWRRRRFVRGRGGIEQMPVPVIVVGNLTVGGAGKTPLVIALVEALRLEGYTPGVVSRGYRGSDTRKKKAVHAVEVDAENAADRFGDEAILIRQRTAAPVYIGRLRVEVARQLLAAHPEVDVVISDDGLQHYRLARNFEIAVFDLRGAGNRRMLPAGPLREPLSRLGTVDAIVLNGDDASLPALPDSIALVRPPFRMTLVPGLPYRVMNPSETRTLQGFRGRRLTAAAGIGYPQRFFSMLSAQGLSFHRMPLDDHYRYRDNPFMRRSSDAVLMTEKDAVKCRRFDEARMWAVPVSAALEPGLIAAVLGNIGGSKRPTSGN